jgi:hypothetical protein
MMRRKRIVLSVLAVGVVLLAAGLYWFQPWKLWVDHRVNDALPDVVVAATHPTGSPATTTSGPTSPPHAVLLSTGTFISHEHTTHGTVSVVRQPDGRRVLAIADLRTSDGPDVHVWLTDAPVRPGKDGWHIFDDGRHLSLGTLKGNLGNQVYNIPPEADLSALTSVSIWCDRFNVSFGAAQLVAR